MAVSEFQGGRGVTVPVETVIAWQAPPLKFGIGATEEVGYELKRLGVTKALIVTDPNLSRLGLPRRVGALIEREGIETEIYDRAHVEPTDVSFRQALSDLEGQEFDGYVGVGGGSSIDTAKAIDLFKTYPADLMHYLNRPIGEGAPVPGPLRPLLAVPTTAGTGSECTPVCVVDILSLKVKSGISHASLRPWMAVVDPLNTLTMPASVTAATGYDVLCHALESYTAVAYNRRPRWPSPAERPAYIGSNPISDVWCEKALALIGKYFRRAVLNPHDLDARVAMAQAATFAGMGFGNAGVHIPHAVAYPIAGMVREYRPGGYEGLHEAMVPHGQSVVVTAPAAFRFTYPCSPDRHLRAAELLGADLRGVSVANGEEVLPRTLIDIIRDTGGPRGVAAFGYGEDDVPGLVEGTLKQQRLLACCPRPVGAGELAAIIRESMSY
ncbi:MAG TPA: hydroxyacid-oxoacid transhydrogenase [Candidatus Dormibacteraeota bacterium]|jgi:hydroxyacid-oxoacid transhydrogenase|nr:hydroxyacid-oxoacid transhydrogenase [Candidatus Dormibacteraeota bacterium]